MTDPDTLAALDRLRTTLAERDAEVARLRADPNRLDLASVPNGWTFDNLTYRWDRGGGKWRCALFQPIRDPRPDVQGTGPTPAAALADAVSKTKKPPPRKDGD